MVDSKRVKSASRSDIKRVVFGVGDRGLNMVLHEGPLRPIGVDENVLPARNGKVGEGVYLAWAAKGAETSTEDNATVSDFNLQLAPGETRFVRVEIPPGAQSSLHRTPQINDYLIALSGELTMVLEDGSTCLLEAGDMFVQLAGWHSWRNEGSDPFVMAGVIIGVRSDNIVPFGVERAQGQVQ
ncbi:MAG: cupin protein [Bradyrhizobium sp.]|nr:cupin protein [Bradyrhizobium sp.]